MRGNCLRYTEVLITINLLLTFSILQGAGTLSNFTITYWAAIDSTGINYNIRHLCTIVTTRRARHAHVLWVTSYPLMYYLHSLAQCYSHLRMDHYRSRTRLARMLTTARMDHNWSWTSSRNKARASVDK